jgi:hypothetical protein
MISVFFFADVSYQRVGLVRARSHVVVVVVVVVNARASVMCLNESKEVEEEKVNTHHEHIFLFCFFSLKKASSWEGRRKVSLFFCRRHSYSRTQITDDTEERDDGDENGVEQRQTGQSSLDFEQQQQQQQQQQR